MRLQVGYFALSNTTGITQSKPIPISWTNIPYDFRIRQKIRDGDEDYVVTGDSWPAFLFPHAKVNPDHIEEGMFRSALLLKVSHELILIR